jgi:hypothetical protein
MFGRYGILRFLLTLLLIGLVVAGGVALYQFAFGQGYQAALASGSGAVSAQPPYPGYAPYWFGWGFPFFFPPFGIFLGIGFIFFLFFIVGGLFRFGGRRHWRDWDDRSRDQPGNPTGPNEPVSKV